MEVLGVSSSGPDDINSGNQKLRKLDALGDKEWLFSSQSNKMPCSGMNNMKGKYLTRFLRYCI